LDRSLNEPLIIVDRGPQFRCAVERLGLKYQRFGIRNVVDSFHANKT
jgi:transposase-like protein